MTCNSSATSPIASQASKAMSGSHLMIYPRPWLTYRHFFADLGTQLLSEAERKRFPEHWILWRHRYILTMVKKFQHLGSVPWFGVSFRYSAGRSKRWFSVLVSRTIQTLDTK